MTLDTVKVLETDTISTSNFKDRFKQRLLTRLQLATALLIFLLECISTGISSRSYWGWGAAICHIGTGVWVGVAGVVTAILGIVWIRRLDRNAPTRRSFTTAYFAMSILSTVFDATLSMLASVCMTQAAGYISYAKINQSYWKYLTIENAHVAVIALNGVMIGVAVANGKCGPLQIDHVTSLLAFSRLQYSGQHSHLPLLVDVQRAKREPCDIDIPSRQPH